MRILLILQGSILPATEGEGTRRLKIVATAAFDYAEGVGAAGVALLRSSGRIRISAVL
jgi:hypothetical protein